MRRADRQARRGVGGRLERAAGLVAPAVPRMADFRANVPSPRAYWLSGSSSTYPVLYWGSSARIVRDVRRAFGVGSGDSYDVELGTALRDRWGELRQADVSAEEWARVGDTELREWRDGEVIPLDLFRALVWFAFVKGHLPFGRNAVLFSREVGIPRVGAPIGSVDASVSVGSGDANANGWAYNPFSGEVPRGGEPVYDPWCAGSTGCDPYRVGDTRGGKKPGGLVSNAAPVLVVAALVAIAGSGAK